MALGTNYLIAGNNSDNAVEVWELVDGLTLTFRASLGGGWVRHLHWKANSSLIISGTSSGMRIYESDGASLTQVYLGSPLGSRNSAGVKWHPVPGTNKFLYVVSVLSTAAKQAGVFGYSSGVVTELASWTSGETVPDQWQAYGSDWCADGVHIAITGAPGGQYMTKILAYDGANTLTTLYSLAGVGSDGMVAWSPNGQHLALVNGQGAGMTLRVYDWDGSSLSLGASTALPDWGTLKGIQWYGNHLFAANCVISPHIRVYEYTGAAINLLDAEGTGGAGNGSSGIAWSEDGTKLLGSVSYDPADGLKAYGWATPNLTLIDDAATTPGDSYTACMWWRETEEGTPPPPYIEPEEKPIWRTARVMNAGRHPRNMGREVRSGINE